MTEDQTDEQALDELHAFLYRDPEQFPSGADVCDALVLAFQRTGRPIPENPALAPDLGVVFATDEHEKDDLPWPLPATAWFWSIGNRWVAVYREWHDDWWEGADPADIAARPPHWDRPIESVPTSGTLVYRDSKGKIVEKELATGGAA